MADSNRMWRSNWSANRWPAPRRCSAVARLSRSRPRSPRPGGSTEAGLEALAAAGGADAFRAAFEGLDRADARELSRGNDPSDEGDFAAYVNGLFTVYIILIFLRVLMSWIPEASGEPRNPGGGRLHP